MANSKEKVNPTPIAEDLNAQFEAVMSGDTIGNFDATMRDVWQPAVIKSMTTPTNGVFASGLPGFFVTYASPDGTQEIMETVISKMAPEVLNDDGKPNPELRLAAAMASSEWAFPIQNVFEVVGIPRGNRVAVGTIAREGGHKELAFQDTVEKKVYLPIGAQVEIRVGLQDGPNDDPRYADRPTVLSRRPRQATAADALGI